MSSMSMVRQVFSNDIFHIRNYGNDASDTFQDRLSRYSSAHHVAAWTIGETAHFSVNPLVNDSNGLHTVSTNWR